jgi:hypothetical protein
MFSCESSAWQETQPISCSVEVCDSGWFISLPILCWTLPIAWHIYDIGVHDVSGVAVHLAIGNWDHYKLLTGAPLKMRAFLDIGPCIVVGVDRRLRGEHCLHYDGGSTHLWNVGLLEREYTALFSRRHSHLLTRSRENLKSHMFFIIILYFQIPRSISKYKVT